LDNIQIAIQEYLAARDELLKDATGSRLFSYPR
jgi:hypothetical protein